MEINFVSGVKVRVYDGINLIGSIDFDVVSGEFEFHSDTSARSFKASALNAISKKVREMNEGEEYVNESLAR